MAEQLSIDNLMLDDNSFKLLEEGTYHFKVVNHTVDYYSGNSTKIPPNTQVVIAELEIPYTDENGQPAVITIKNNLHIYKKALFAVRQFAECIRLCSESGRESINLHDMDGKTGICEIDNYEAANGNTYNNVKTCYAPSKAPKVCANDKEFEAYMKNDGFETSVPDDVPWGDE